MASRVRDRHEHDSVVEANDLFPQTTVRFRDWPIVKLVLYPLILESTMKDHGQDITAYASNLRRVFDRASFLDQIEGNEWYGKAKAECRKISRETDYPLKRVVFAVAVLSNNKSWEQNVVLARNVAFSLRHGIKLTGHFSDLLDKAKRILEDGDFSALSGPKVVPFAMAMWQPSSNASVIDRWMWRAANDGRSPGRCRH